MSEMKKKKIKIDVSCVNFNFERYTVCEIKSLEASTESILNMIIVKIINTTLINANTEFLRNFIAN
jgi:hypothetical protein